MPVIVNKNNHAQWPRVVSEDVLQNVYLLKNRVHVLAGHVKGKTSLPLPAGRKFNNCLTSGDMYVSFKSFVVVLSNENKLSFSDIEIAVVIYLTLFARSLKYWHCIGSAVRTGR